MRALLLTSFLIGIHIDAFARLPSNTGVEPTPSAATTRVAGTSLTILYRGCMMGCLGLADEKACAEKCAALIPDLKPPGSISDAGCRGLHTRERTGCLQKKYLTDATESAAVTAPTQKADAATGSAR